MTASPSPSTGPTLALVGATGRFAEAIVSALALRDDRWGAIRLLAPGVTTRTLGVRGREQQIEVLREDAGDVLVRVAAGHVWDEAVAWTVEQGLGGVEALSGIPGSAGATPVQNVGAYGADVSQVLVSLRAWDRLVPGGGAGRRRAGGGQCARVGDGALGAILGRALRDGG